MSGTYIGNMAPISNQWPSSTITGIYGSMFKLFSRILTDKSLLSLVSKK